jgi:hypothetical protein
VTEIAVGQYRQPDATETLAAGSGLSPLPPATTDVCRAEYGDLAMQNGFSGVEPFREASGE